MTILKFCTDNGNKKDNIRSFEQIKGIKKIILKFWTDKGNEKDIIEV